LSDLDEKLELCSYILIALLMILGLDVDNLI
jgi:hypothetical protein